jgi:hypothetical protein
LQRRFFFFFTRPLPLSDLSLSLNCCAEHNATMAVIDELPQQAAAPQPIDIEAWTEQATAALGSVTISTPGEVARATAVTLAIPLDDDALASGGPVQPVGAAAVAKEGGLYKRKAPVRRDSMNRREALLKGKEGSRQRRRWENGTFRPRSP